MDIITKFDLFCVSKTDVGKKRTNNEDAISFYIPKDSNIISGFLAIADGVGGSDFGELASKTSVDELTSFFNYSSKKYLSYCNSNKLNPNDIELNLKQIFSYINEMVLEESSKRKINMATTLTCCILFEGFLFYAHLGDSRLYIFRNNEIKQITNDDKDFENKSSKKNFITQAIGASYDMRVQTGHIKLYSKDKILLCTDGLYNFVSDEEIKKLLSLSDLNNIANKFILRANELGGKDNISVIVAEINEKNSNKNLSDFKIKIMFAILSIFILYFLLVFFDVFPK